MQSGYPQRLCFLIHNQSTLRKKHNKIFMLNIVIPYGSAFLLGTSLATLFIKKILPISIIIGIITLALIYLINYLFLSKFLHFSSNLQQQTIGKKELLNNSFFPIYFHCLYLSTTYKRYALQVLSLGCSPLSFLSGGSPAIL